MQSLDGLAFVGADEGPAIEPDRSELSTAAPGTARKIGDHQDAKL
jgi:hypothetical protein